MFHKDFSCLNLHVYEVLTPATYFGKDEDDSNTAAPANVGSSSLKRHLDEELDEDTVTSTPADKTIVPSSQDNGPPAKKITLNRKALSQQATPVSSEVSIEGSKPVEEDDPKKVVKLSEISMKEVFFSFIFVSDYSLCILFL